MVCPFLEATQPLADGFQPESQCRDCCAWWDHVDECCCIATIATALNKIHNLLARPRAFSQPIVVQRGCKVTEQDGTLHITKED